LSCASGLFPSGFRGQNFVHISHLPCMLHAFTILSLIWSSGEENDLCSSSWCNFFLTSCHFIPLRSKYSPSHPVLKHHQSVSPAYHSRQSFMPIQKLENSSFVHFNL
jgi:hypothetical protein